MARRLAPLSLVFSAALACASNPPATGPTAGTPPPAPSGPTAGDRARSAVEGMMMGAMIGSAGGPFGSAAGAVTLLVYGAITGDVPFRGSRGGGGGAYPVPGGGGAEAQSEQEMDQQIDAEVAREDSLEDQIEAELKRQEDLLKSLDQQEASHPPDASTAQPTVTEGDLAKQADPRAAPKAPTDRQLPASLFDEQHRTIPKGAWGNDKKLEVMVRSLDADRDGAPEEIRYYDEKSGVILRKEEDRNYDGTIDAWITYDSGIVSKVEIDNSGKGKPDEWQTYGRDGLMATREVDRDGDGKPDAWYQFAGGSLVEERHAGKVPGSYDRIVSYENRRVIRTEEDTTGNGKIDTWTTYRPDGDRDVVDRIERDTKGTGKPDTFEQYEQVAGKTTLKQREEDRNGDGKIDVVSTYENGKLKQREIRDPALVPL